jgi:hypothetical protein
MRNDILLKKGVTFGSICVIICAIFSGSVIAQKTHMIHETSPRGEFGLQSMISISWDPDATNEPLTINVPYTVTLNVTYSTVKALFGNFILWYCILTYQNVNVSLKLENVPSWCTANLSNSQLVFPVNGSTITDHTLLFISVNEHAPAFQSFPITINASVNTMMGPFGFMPFVQGNQQTSDMIFVPGYLPLINVTPTYSYIETTPGFTVLDPITVENLGNGKTLVDVKFIEIPQNWVLMINPAQLIIDVNESKVTNLTIIPPQDFYGIETITLSFTPKSYSHPEYEGTALTIHIIVNVRS